LGVGLDTEPASIGSRPHMMHHDQDSSSTAAVCPKKSLYGNSVSLLGWWRRRQKNALSTTARFPKFDGC